MIDHLTLHVKDLPRTRAFYTQALEPLGYAVQMEFDGTCAFGPEGKPILWFRSIDAPTPTHLAFVASSRGAVDAFHAAALAAGGADNGAPGVREHYHPTYYAAFVLDPDGHNLEAVCHAAPEPAKALARAPAKRSRAPARASRSASGKLARKAVPKKTRRKPAKRG